MPRGPTTPRAAGPTSPPTRRPPTAPAPSRGGGGAPPTPGAGASPPRGVPPTRPLSRQIKGPGPISFARGLEVEVTLDESSFEGTGVFLLGAVLEQFFARYVSTNSFTETVVKAAERGEVMRWPAKPGRRQTF